MKNYELSTIYTQLTHKTLRFCAFVICFSFHTYGCFAQVATSIDSTSIQIGGEIRYKMQIEADAAEVVVFPEGQTFAPLEVIESFKTDTTRNGNKLSLIKEYALTQFDSGRYTIPRQKIMIGNQTVFSDSLQVQVRDVLVDTTKQKMYQIKPLVEVDATRGFWDRFGTFITYFILGLIVITIIVFIIYFSRKKKQKKALNELPPYEKAILALKQIDESHLLEQDSHKEYYSKLSDTARKYIDDEVYDHAMESTTDELIARLDHEIKYGSLNLDTNTIKELKAVLKTADMAKFANSKPDVITAKADRNVIEKVINETKDAIPEPTEEELLADEEYRRNKAEKKRIRLIAFGSIAGVILLMITLLIFILIKGFDTVKDSILGHPTKELAEGEWMSSAYGSPPVTVATPEVLIRNQYQLTEEQKQQLRGNETFVYGSLIGNFYINVSTVNYKEPTEINLNEIVEGVVGYFESQGAKNISVKDEEYETLGGAEGIKVFGTMEVMNPVSKKNQKNEYEMLNFAENGGFQQVIVVYDKEDRYATDVAKRIINSVELKSAE
ncbi:DUF4381 domain-containing protein [Aquimarina addita]|uniref:DUF4381 domain-containing protein n=1 Tax=Aquimarina addita TaxID=870485 RepID=UPI0031E58EA3